MTSEDVLFSEANIYTVMLIFKIVITLIFDVNKYNSISLSHDSYSLIIIHTYIIFTKRFFP